MLLHIYQPSQHTICSVFCLHVWLIVYCCVVYCCVVLCAQQTRQGGQAASGTSQAPGAAGGGALRGDRAEGGRGGPGDLTPTQPMLILPIFSILRIFSLSVIEHILNSFPDYVLLIVMYCSWLYSSVDHDHHHGYCDDRCSRPTRPPRTASRPSKSSVASKPIPPAPPPLPLLLRPRRRRRVRPRDRTTTFPTSQAPNSTSSPPLWIALTPSR